MEESQPLCSTSPKNFRSGNGYWANEEMGRDFRMVGHTFTESPITFTDVSRIARLAKVSKINPKLAKLAKYSQKLAKLATN